MSESFCWELPSKHHILFKLSEVTGTWPTNCNRDRLTEHRKKSQNPLSMSWAHCRVKGIAVCWLRHHSSGTNVACLWLLVLWVTYFKKFFKSVRWVVFVYSVNPWMFLNVLNYFHRKMYCLLLQKIYYINTIEICTHFIIPNFSCRNWSFLHINGTFFYFLEPIWEFSIKIIF